MWVEVPARARTHTCAATCNCYRIHIWRMSLPPPPHADGSTVCPLCRAEVSPFMEVQGRRYVHCDTCDLVSVHPDDLPSRDEEAGRYLAHENDRNDPGYVTFLRRLADPLCD